MNENQKNIKEMKNFKFYLFIKFYNFYYYLILYSILYNKSLWLFNKIILFYIKSILLKFIF